MLPKVRVGSYERPSAFSFKLYMQFRLYLHPIFIGALRVVVKDSLFNISFIYINQGLSSVLPTSRLSPI